MNLSTGLAKLDAGVFTLLSMPEEQSATSNLWYKAVVWMWRFISLPAGYGMDGMGRRR